MEDKKQEQQNRYESDQAEIVVGYDSHYYNFYLENELVMSTNRTNDSSLLDAGRLVAARLKKKGFKGYKIVNGESYQRKYDIPEEEAEKIIRARADDPFWSGSMPPSHLERTACRELMPDQLDMFRHGLEQGLDGNQKPQETAERKDNLTLYLRTYNAVTQCVQELINSGKI
jgi:hypothetical protein